MNNVKHYFSQNTNALLYFQLLTTMQCMYFQLCDEIFYATCEVKNQHLHTFFITIILAAFPFHIWTTLKQFGLPSKKGTGSSSKQSIGLTIDKELCFDSSKVAECFNHVYTTVAAN